MSQSRLLKRAVSGARVTPGLLMAASLCAMLGVASSGCDTVALLSFSDRVFQDVRLVGLTPEGGMCRGSNGALIGRFVMADGDGAPIDDQTVIGSRAVTLERGDLVVDNLVHYDFPERICADTSECTSGFACDTASAGAVERACQLTSGGVTINGVPRVVSSTTRTQALGVLVENSASMSGELPTVLQGLIPDYRGVEPGSAPDGKADPVGSDYTLLSTTRATDNNNTRSRLASDIETTWARVFTRARTDYQVRTSLGVWTFGASRGSVTSMAPGGKDPVPTQWATTPAAARATIENLRNEGRSAALASVYEAMEDVITKEDKFAAFPDAEKMLIVVVDGPDDLRLPDITAQRVIERANEAGVRIFIVQLDPAVVARTASGTPLLPDVPDYVQFQSAECTSDADCRNYERCRTVTTFANNSGQNVTQPAGKTSGTYCAIERDENGRIGPIQDYAEIACATGGGYFHLSTRSSDGGMAGYQTVAQLPLGLDGLWEVELDADAFSRGVLESGEAYRLGLSFSATVDGTSRRHLMTEDFLDARPVVFSGE